MLTLSNSVIGNVVILIIIGPVIIVPAVLSLYNPTNATIYITFLAALVALFVAFLPKILDYRYKPMLKIEFENTEPYCRYSSMHGTPNDSYWIRLRVVNMGKSIAKRCEVRLDKITYQDTNEEIQNFDSTPLRWVSAGLESTFKDSSNNIYNRFEKSIDINATAHEYINVIHTERNNPNLFLDPFDATPRGVSFIIPKINYVLHITVYSENANLVERRYMVRTEYLLDKVELQEL